MALPGLTQMLTEYQLWKVENVTYPISNLLTNDHETL